MLEEYKGVQRLLGGNSKFDRHGNPYEITIQDKIIGKRHNLKFNSRYEFIDALHVFKEFAKLLNTFAVVSHSNTDSTNVDTNNLI